MIFDEKKDIDFAFVYTKANEILTFSSAITTFPFKLKQLIREQTDIRLYSYSKALTKYGISIETIGSESAVLMEYFGANIIFYNDKEPNTRVRFSIAHEFGHYVLEHKMNLLKDDPLYDKQEIEANFFAAQLLMPEQLIREAVKRGQVVSIGVISEKFGVSEYAAEKRKGTLLRYEFEWRKESEKMYDDVILKKYGEFLERIAPQNSYTFYDYEYEEERQRERDSWNDSRTIW